LWLENIFLYARIGQGRKKEEIQDNGFFYRDVQGLQDRGGEKRMDFELKMSRPLIKWLWTLNLFLSF